MFASFQTMGAQIEAKDSCGSTPLHCADNAEVANCLINKGANIESKDENGSTPLHIASSEGRTDVVKCLTEMGAQIEAKKLAPGGETPLHCAGNAEVAKYLIQKGANIEAKDDDGSTPLHVSVESDRLDVVKQLIEMGAEKEAKASLTALRVDWRLSSTPNHTSMF